LHRIFQGADLESILTNEFESVDGVGGEFLWSSPPQHVYLLPQRLNLWLKRSSRADQIDEHPTNKPCKDPSWHTSVARFSIHCRPDKVCDRNGTTPFEAAWPVSTYPARDTGSREYFVIQMA
jgi:hypothetical protein